MRTTVARATRRPASARMAACARIWEVSCQCFTDVPQSSRLLGRRTAERDGVPGSYYPLVHRGRAQAREPNKQMQSDGLTSGSWWQSVAPTEQRLHRAAREALPIIDRAARLGFAAKGIVAI